MPDTANSAFYGQPPLNDKDRTIIRGLFGTKPLHPIVIPPGQPKTAAPAQVIGLSIAIVVTVLVTGARLFNRIFRKGQKFGWDDAVIIPGVMLALTFFSNILVRVSYGCAGKHLNDCTYQQFAFFIQLGGINQITFFASVTLIKISMCLFIRRMTGSTSRRWQILNNIFLGVLTVWFFLTFFLNLFQCWPVTAFFNFAFRVDTKDYHCLQTGKMSDAFSIINCVFDFILLCVPAIIIFKIQMPFWKQVRLAGLFCVGIACCVCSAWRSTIGHRHSKDIPFIFVHEVSWTIADVFFSALVASLPGVNALLEIGFARMSTKIGSTFGYSGGGSTGTKTSQNASQSRKLSQSVTRSANRSSKFPWFKRGDSGFGEGMGKGGIDGSKERLHSTDGTTTQISQVGDLEKGGTARYEMEITDVELGGMNGAKKPEV